MVSLSIHTDTAAWYVEIFSRRVHMFGGVEIYINGPCFDPTDTITCTFGSGDKTIEVTGMHLKLPTIARN